MSDPLGIMARPIRGRARPEGANQTAARNVKLHRPRISEPQTQAEQTQAQTQAEAEAVPGRSSHGTQHPAPSIQPHTRSNLEIYLD